MKACGRYFTRHEIKRGAMGLKWPENTCLNGALATQGIAWPGQNLEGPFFMAIVFLIFFHLISVTSPDF